MTIEEILAKQQRGETPSKEEIDYLLTAFGKAVAGKVPTGEGYQTAEDMMGPLMAVLDSVRSTPEGQARLRDKVAESKEKRFVKRYSPFFDAILAGADVVSSLAQVRQSKEALRDIKRPGMPSVPGIDPALDNAIRGAEVGTMDAARAVAPARQELQDQYAKDIALAKSVGGGQASTLGAMGQVASMRRSRGAAGLAPMVDSIRAREQGRLDGLINQRAGQRNQDYYNRFRQSQVDMDQYNRDVMAAGQLGSVARLNMRNSAHSLLNQAPRVMSRIGNGYNDKYSTYEQMLNKSLTRQLPQAPRQPFNDQAFYGNQTPIQLDDNFESSAFYNPFS